MRKPFFLFFDYNDANDVEYEIEGEDFETLIELCFQYSTQFAFSFSDESLRAEEESYPALFRHIISKRPIQNHMIRAYFVCNDDTKHYLLKSFHCLLSWYWSKSADGRLRPENLTFFRTNGSILFSSVTHEGVCALYPEKSEDFSKVICKPGWMEGDETGWYVPWGKTEWLYPQQGNNPETSIDGSNQSTN